MTPESVTVVEFDGQTHKLKAGESMTIKSHPTEPHKTDIVIRHLKNENTCPCCGHEIPDEEEEDSPRDFPDPFIHREADPGVMIGRATLDPPVTLKPGESMTIKVDITTRTDGEPCQKEE